MKTKKCVRCQKRKRLSSFSAHTKAKDGKTSYCKPCFAEYQRERLYGIKPPEYEALLALQDGLCAICRQKMRSPHTDHSHVTGMVRGLLCSPCNKGIGHLMDDPLTTARAVVYLLQGGVA